MRPLIAAALTAHRARRRGSAGAAGHLHLPGGRGAHRGLESLLGEDEVAYYPAWETLPHERLSARARTPSAAGWPCCAGWPVTPTTGDRRCESSSRRSAACCSPGHGLGDLGPVRLRVGEDVDLDELVAALVGAAYVRVDLVERRGEFAVRGGIVDVFPPTEEHPVRVDFFGDTVEEIRYFSVADQRSLETGRAGIVGARRAASCC